MSQAGINNTTGGPTPSLLTLTGDTGGPITPQGNNINISGGDNVSVDGNNATATLTINVNGAEATVTTTDATPTLIYSVTIPSGQAVTITCDFVAIENDLSTALGGTSFTVARNAGGGAQLSGGAHTNIITNTGGIPDINYNESGNDIQILVVGAAATTLDWRMFIKTLFSV